MAWADLSSKPARSLGRSTTPNFFRKNLLNIQTLHIRPWKTFQCREAKRGILYNHSCIFDLNWLGLLTCWEARRHFVEATSYGSPWIYGTIGKERVTVHIFVLNIELRERVSENGLKFLQFLLLKTQKALHSQSRRLVSFWGSTFIN